MKGQEKHGIYEFLTIRIADIRIKHFKHFFHDEQIIFLNINGFVQL